MSEEDAQQSWRVILTAPCPWCVMWIGPHRHLMRTDGAPGVIVQRLTAEMPLMRPVDAQAAEGDTP